MSNPSSDLQRRMPPRTRLRSLSFAALALAPVAFGACKAGEDYVPPKTADSKLSWNGRLEGVLTTGDLDPDQLARWWETLGDEQLNALMKAGARANLDLRTAQAQVRRARAERNIALADRGPTVNMGGGANATAREAGSAELYSAGLDASWELDVFGRIARGVEATEADLQAVEEARRDVLVSILAEIALNYIDLRTLQRQKSISLANLAAQDRSVAILTAQLEKGRIARLEVDRATTTAETTRAALPALDQQIRLTMNRLAVLVGEQPGALDAQLQARAMPSLPTVDIALGVPAEVLRRRPDVRRAERSLAAQTARVGVAKADLYPRFTLTGTIGLESPSLSSLFRTASGMLGLGAGGNWVAFDNGRIRERINVQDALQEEAMIDYERVILLALEDVEGAVVAFTQEQLRYKSLSNAADAARRAADLAQARYDAGAELFLSVLDAQRSRLAAEDEQVRSEGAILQNLVRLYKSLGGGWDPRTTNNG